MRNKKKRKKGGGGGMGVRENPQMGSMVKLTAANPHKMLSCISIISLLPSQVFQAGPSGLQNCPNALRRANSHETHTIFRRSTSEDHQKLRVNIGHTCFTANARSQS